MIWWFYQAKSEPCVPAFERIFKRRRTGYATLDGLLMRLFTARMNSCALMIGMNGAQGRN